MGGVCLERIKLLLRKAAPCQTFYGILWLTHFAVTPMAGVSVFYAEPLCVLLGRSQISIHRKMIFCVFTVELSNLGSA